jgi:hypothetical protein
LPAHICQTILHHHDTGIFTDHSHPAPAEVRNFAALLILAEHLVSVLLGLEDDSATALQPVHAHALNHFGMEEPEFQETALDILGDLRQGRS